MAKPKVTTNCVANHYSASCERIVEISGSRGSGALVSIVESEDGGLHVHIYRRERCGVSFSADSKTLANAQ